MAFSTKLAELFVAFTTRGVEALQQSIGSIHTSLKQVETGAAAVGRVASYAFATAGLAAYGFAKAGLSASSAGQVLSFEMERLSRTIAGLFGPEIRALINYLNQVHNWFAQLTDKQRENIAMWVKAAAAGLAVAIILPRVIGFVALLVNGLRAATVAFAMLNASTGGALVFLGGLITVLAGMGAASTVAEGGLSALVGSFQQLFAIAQEMFGRIVTAMQPLLDVGQRLFAALGPLLAALGNLFVRLVETIAPVVAVIGEALIPAVQFLTVVVGALAEMISMVDAKWLAAIATFLAVIAIVPRIITAITSLIAALRALTIAQILQKAFAGPIGWAQLATGAAIAAVGVGAAALAYSAVGKAAEEAGKKAEGAGKKMKEATGGRGPLAMKVTGFEGIEAAYNRIALASIQATAGMKPPEERQVEQLEMANEKLGNIHGAIRDGKPLWNK